MAEINQQYKTAIDLTISNLREEGLKYDLYLDLMACCQYGYLYNTECKEYYKTYTDYIKEIALKEVTEDAKHAKTWRQLYWDTLRLESFWFFESYLLYMERKRPYEKRFYEPRQKTLKTVVDDLQALEFSKTQEFYGLSLPARVGKSTIILFFFSWIILRKPESHNAIGTHSGILAKHFHKELLDIFTTDDYSFFELYSFFQPGKEFIVDKSADDLTISFVSKGDYPSITCRGIDGTWTGAIDISSDGYLAVDDLVRDRTHSLSPKRMNDTFSEYLNKMVDRMNDGAKQLMIGTLWNVMDPLMRLEEMYKNNENYIFRRIPALNEKDESNFDYEFKGFSTKYYRDMRDRLIKAGNEAEWMAKYQQAPYVREGLLFPRENLRWFNGILPPDHRYYFVVCCDVAFGGGDSVSMPIGLQDEDTNWIYVVDWYFNSAGVKVTVPGVVDMIIKHGIRSVTFERNNGGLLFAKQIQEELNNRNYACSCDTRPAPNNIDKQSKIKAYENYICTKLIFLDGTIPDTESLDEDMVVYKRSAQYERALEELSMFVAIGKNSHDDAADSVSQLCAKAFGDINSLSEVETIDRAILGF